MDCVCEHLARITVTLAMIFFVLCAIVGVLFGKGK